MNRTRANEKTNEDEKHAMTQINPHKHVYLRKNISKFFASGVSMMVKYTSFSDVT